MLKKFLTLIPIVLLVIVVGSIFFLNQTKVSVIPWYGVESEFWKDKPLAIFLIGYFLFGFVFASLIAFFYGTRASLTNWRLRKKTDMTLSHAEEIIHAREEIAACNFDKARAMLAKIIARDKNNVVAKIHNAQSYEKEGNLKEALRLIEEARAEHPKNIELLFSAASLNHKIGNSTAAFDNISLVLKHDKNNTRALEMMAEFCESIKKYDQAAEYLENLLKFVKPSQIARIENWLSEVTMKKLQSENISEQEVLDGLYAAIRRNRNYAPLYLVTGRLEAKLDKQKAALKSFTKGFELSGDKKFLEAAAQALTDGKAGKDAATQLKAIAESYEQSEPRGFNARIFLADYYLKHDQLANASEIIESLKQNPSNKSALELSRATLLLKRGSSQEAFDILKELVTSSGALDSSSSKKESAEVLRISE